MGVRKLKDFTKHFLKANRRPLAKYMYKTLLPEEFIAILEDSYNSFKHKG